MDILRTYKPVAMRKYGITSLCLFGSTARGEQHDGSDVDVCYTGDAMSLLTLDSFQSELESLFGCNVDLVRMRPNMNEVLRQQITRDAIYA